jgi:hypothetical protein
MSSYVVQVQELTPDGWVDVGDNLDFGFIALTDYKNIPVETIKLFKLLRFQFQSETTETINIQVELEDLSTLRGNSTLLLNRVITPAVGGGDILQQLITNDNPTADDYSQFQEYVNSLDPTYTTKLSTTIETNKWYGLLTFNNTINNIFFTQSGTPTYNLNFYLITEE